MKTKIGVSATLLAAGVYFSALFGGYIPLVVVAGYILIAEENEWLRRTAVKAAILKVVFDLLALAMNFIPAYLLDFIRDIVYLFNGSFNYSVVTNIFTVLGDIVRICEVVLFVILGIKALKMQDVKIGAVDSAADKNLENRD